MNSGIGGGASLLNEFAMVRVGAEILVAKKEGVIATVSFWSSEAIREFDIDVLGPALINLGQVLFLSRRVIRHKTSSDYDCRVCPCRTARRVGSSKVARKLYISKSKCKEDCKIIL